MAPGSSIPDRSMVGLGAVVTHAFDEPGQMIAGVPARAARPLDPDDLAFLYYKTRPDLPDLRRQ